MVKKWWKNGDVMVEMWWKFGVGMGRMGKPKSMELEK